MTADPVLLVKTSSLGDVIHLLPALTDAHRHHPEIRFHWLVEEAFAEIPAWHPAVERVIPVALRRWRRSPANRRTIGEIRRFLNNLRRDRYQRVIDAQGLIKSAFLTALARGEGLGPDRRSAREPVAAFFYRHPLPVPKNDHAVNRLRCLLADGLDYPRPRGPIDYGLSPPPSPLTADEKQVVFLHGTTWTSKHWPEPHWHRLAELAADAGVRVLLPWGNEREKNRARAIATAAPDHCRVLPKTDLATLAGLLAGADGVVAVDSGLGHLTAALATPGVHLYGPTDPKRTGAVGHNQIHLTGVCPEAPCLQRTCPLNDRHSPQPPCFRNLTPERVWNAL